MSGCLGEGVAALVDGELDHPARERAQRHLAHCAACRSEVEAHRALKARLNALVVSDPALPDALTARLLALPAPGSAPVAGPTGAVRPVSLRPAAGPSRRSPSGRSSAGRRRRLRRGAAVGSVLAVLGVAMALGGPQTAGTTPVDPATDSFVVQHVGTTGEVPRVVEAGLTGSPRR